MRALTAWTTATFVLAFLVIIAGGVVRMTQSGMGCPDWPRCFGKWIPPTSVDELPADFEKYLRKQDIDHTFNAYHTWIEYVNRLLGVLLGVFAILQIIIARPFRKSYRTAWKLSLAFLAIVVLTGLFGALVVRLNLAHLSVSMHLLFAVILLQIQLALWLAVRNRLFQKNAGSFSRRLWLLLLIFIMLQSVFGTMVRMFVDDISLSLKYDLRETWLNIPPVAFLIHRTFSWVVLAMTLFIFWTSRKSGFRKPLLNLLFIILASMATGISLYYAGMPPLAQPVHLLLVSLAITQLMSLLLQSNTQPYDTPSPAPTLNF